MIKTKERKPETKEEEIARLGESDRLLFESMLKFGYYTKAHGILFARIRGRLKELGVVFDEGSGDY